MPKLGWYWKRLASMSPLEAALHARRKLYQFADGGERHWPAIPVHGSGVFPRLPKPADAPPALRDALRLDVDRILSGRWRAFGHLELQVDDPPHWHKDYHAGKDVSTTASAFALDHRELPDGADIKLIWELSRWHQLVRLAMSAYVLDDERAAWQCIDWLEDWVKHNRPYRGWNWTSALEVGMRLVQFTWIDGLLEERAALRGRARGDDGAARLARLRQDILPPHVWFTWRHQSFGSSANNHVIGELAGLILATVRWPALARFGASPGRLQHRWEHEVLAQFAPDGGNREQALNYHLFSWELCWQTRAALRAAGRSVSAAVDERLRRAAQFYVDLQVPNEPWDYGDSDSAFATPFVARETHAVSEWHQWLAVACRSAALNFWWEKERSEFGASPTTKPSPMPCFLHYRESGQAILRRGAMTVRVDASPLGYLNTAAHGHLDALHISLWLGGVAMIVDPGTAAYYGNTRLREWLASALAHNAPCSSDGESPRRFGPFLWGAHHARPVLRIDADEVHAKVQFRRHSAERRFRPLGDVAGLQVEDRCLWNGGPRNGHHPAFSVRWQFAPGATLEQVGERRFRVTRKGASLVIEVSDDWAEVCPIDRQGARQLAFAARTDLEAQFAGTVSAAFRRVEWAPFLMLVARSAPERSSLFRTTFLAASIPDSSKCRLDDTRMDSAAAFVTQVQPLVDVT